MMVPSYERENPLTGRGYQLGAATSMGAMAMLGQETTSPPSPVVASTGSPPEAA